MMPFSRFVRNDLKTKTAILAILTSSFKKNKLAERTPHKESLNKQKKNSYWIDPIHTWEEVFSTSGPESWP